MATFDISRRGFLRRLGIGAGAAGAGAIAVACGGDSSNDKAKAYKEYKEQNQAAATAPTAAAGGTLLQATDHTAHAGASVEDMDGMHEKGVKQFLASTKEMTSTPLPFTMDGDAKVFQITCKAVKWEIRPGEMKEAFSYNGVLPGPEVRVTEGDRVRFVVKNELPESTSIHWHGLYTPNNMDGVPYITQPPIKPGDSFTYEFVAKPSGTHMYHSHHNAMEQVGKGLLGAFIVEPKDKTKYPAYDKEYTMVLNDTLLSFTLNGKSFPATQVLKAKLGQKVLVRYINEGLMNHPMHLHGMPMKIVAKDGYPLTNPYFCDTQDIAPGDRYDALIDCTEPGAWAFHCHTLSHAESPQGMFGLVTVLLVE